MRRIVVCIYIMGSFFYSGCSDNRANTLIQQFPGKADENKMSESLETKTEKKLPVQNYMEWVDNLDNGLKVEKNIGDFTFSFQYKPLDYVALMELKKDSIKTTELKKKISEYDGLQYFNFRISADSRTELLKKDLKETNEYYARIQYYAFDMQKDLKLIDGKDTLDCVLFHFERVFGLAPYATFVLGFPMGKGTNDKTLCYNEKVFGVGKIYLTVQSKNIKRLPSVITY